jgi:hypothetical protein
MKGNVAGKLLPTCGRRLFGRHIHTIFATFNFLLYLEDGGSRFIIIVGN